MIFQSAGRTAVLAREGDPPGALAQTVPELGPDLL
jgi:hypothetical protein